jgi:hypothetical protein
MGTKTPEQKGTDKFMRQGHTAHDYGNDPGYTKKSNTKPRDLKPGK